MKARLFSVTFDVQVHNTDKGNFKIPKEICNLFTIDDFTRVNLHVDDMSGSIRRFNKKPTSGQEVQLGKHNYHNEQIIRVTLFNPRH